MTTEPAADWIIEQRRNTESADWEPVPGMTYSMATAYAETDRLNRLLGWEKYRATHLPGSGRAR